MSLHSTVQPGNIYVARNGENFRVLEVSEHGLTAEAEKAPGTPFFFDQNLRSTISREFDLILWKRPKA